MGIDIQKRVQRVVILGSTGTIGINALKVIARYPKKFQVIGLTANTNVKLLEKQARQFSPKYVAVGERNIADLRKRLGSRKIKVLSVNQDLSEIVSLPAVDIVVIGVSGSIALSPFLSAVRAGKRVAPANKEALVIAGEIIMRQARRTGAQVIPVDSEQSAIFQCLDGRNRQELEKVYLTASGGALYKVPKSRFDKLTVAQILKHPRWKMGKKITVDSATLMNKGFEVIEAIRLFQLSTEDIEVVIHPEAIIHSMVSFQDGSIIAQLGITDMRLPIQYALTYPQRFDTGLGEMNFFKVKQFNFAKPDLRKFPALSLAIHTAKKGGTLPSVLNAADEEAVDAFLKGKISFSAIYKTVEKVVLKHRRVKNPRLQDILAADVWAREQARNYMA